MNRSELKDWIQAFAKQFEMAGSISMPVEEIIQTLDLYYQRRLSSIRANINNDYPQGTQWLNAAISGMQLDLEPNVKQRFQDYLLERALNTDALLQITTAEKDQLTLAIEIHQSEDEERGPIYSNIELIRKLLGIDKHLILILDSELNQMPKHSLLLERIKTFAIDPTHPKKVNFSNLDPWDIHNWQAELAEDPNRMWKTYCHGIAASASNLIALEAAKRAFRNNHTSRSVFAMLTQEPTYRELLKRDRGNPKFADRHAQAICFSAEADVALEAGEAQEG